ncbi:MAG: putative urea ABC transporter substrate-binding protein [Aureliella sp.]
MIKRFLNITCLCSAVLLAGCNNSDSRTNAGGGPVDAPEGTPTFSLAWSEYPSWSVFGVADELDLINGEEGKLGTIEEKHGVDIVLKEAGYDSCLNMYTSKNCDAVCMTNMDALIVCPNRSGIAFLPTSTSVGADACIVVGIDDIDALKEHKIYGLQGTVSQYCFARCIEESAKASGGSQTPGDYDFTNQDPGAAAVAMSQKQESHKAIMVWNPFVLQTLNDRPDAKVLFDSSMIPGEIVDMVVMGADVKQKDGADKFAAAVAETFYAMNEKLADKEIGDEVLVELGKKFSQLQLDDMKKVVQQTQFYKTAEDGKKLLTGDEFKATMKVVEKFCVEQELVESPTYDFGTDTGSQLLFDASTLESL